MGCAPGAADPRFLNDLGVLLGPPFIDGNRHQVLQNGDEIFPAMLAAIRGAKISITFESYIYWSGDIGREFATSLVERSRRITFAEWSARPLKEKIAERLAALFGSQL